MRLDRVNKQADGQEGQKCGQAGSQAAPDKAVPSRPAAGPDVVTSHVTVISQLGRELNAPFLIQNPKKSTHGF